MWETREAGGRCGIVIVVWWAGRDGGFECCYDGEWMRSVEVSAGGECEGREVAGEDGAGEAAAAAASMPERRHGR